MDSSPTHDGWKRKGLAVVALLWAGILFGVSFLATPAKFQAPSLTLAVAVDVGRATFPVLNRTELVLAAIALVLALLGGARAWRMWVALGVAVGLLAAETFWLLPALDVRAAVVVAGGEPEPSRLHTVYVAMDAVKFMALFLVGVGSLGIGEEKEA